MIADATAAAPEANIVKFVLKKLLWFPLILLITWTLPLTRRMVECVQRPHEAC